MWLIIGSLMGKDTRLGWCCQHGGVEGEEAWPIMKTRWQRDLPAVVAV